MSVLPSAPARATSAPEIKVAKEAGLHYVSSDADGFMRHPVTDGFRYTGPDGRTLRDRATLMRIRALGIPPAWRDVWICSSPKGHIQATGRDVRGRKQYRYHADWSAARGASKFERMVAFGRVLPRIRRTVTRDLRGPGLSRRKVLAVVVRLLEATMIRVGNEEYARQNHSFGLTTLRDRHVTFAREAVHFHFMGKSGKIHDIDLHAPRLARLVKRLQDLPGQDLFQYCAPEARPQRVTSEDVNTYLRDIAGEAFSAKDFRTWAGTRLAAQTLRDSVKSQARPSKRLLNQAIAAVAARLGNTPAICRRCYIHPVVLDGYLAGRTIIPLAARTRRTADQLSSDEFSLLAFLQQPARRGDSSLISALSRSLRRTRRRR